MKVANPTISGNDIQGSEAVRGGRDKLIDKMRESQNSSGSSAVNAEISSEAKEFAKAEAIAKGAPDVRAEKIAELRRRIAEKDYNVKPSDIADKMVDEHMRTRNLK